MLYAYLCNRHWGHLQYFRKLWNTISINVFIISYKKTTRVDRLIHSFKTTLTIKVRPIYYVLNTEHRNCVFKYTYINIYIYVYVYVYVYYAHTLIYIYTYNIFCNVRGFGEDIWFRFVFMCLRGKGRNFSSTLLPFVFCAPTNVGLPKIISHIMLAEKI